MEKSIKFLGIMILISSLVISLGGIIENMYLNRYEYMNTGYKYEVFDKLKGIRYGHNADGFYKWDYPNMKIESQNQWNIIAYLNIEK